MVYNSDTASASSLLVRLAGLTKLTRSLLAVWFYLNVVCRSCSLVNHRSTSTNPKRQQKMESKKLKQPKAPKSEVKAPLRRWEEAEDEDFCNPDKLLVCPYDPNHQIRACRFPYHLLKCKKNHPELANQLWTCPFNARHLMPKHELSHHMSNCVDRCSVSADYVESAETQRKFQVPVNNWTTPECDEDWDQEEEETVVPATPFVWGLSTSQLGQERSEPTVTNSLSSSLRAPRVFPWKLDK
ncbi:gametocyte-specific factor 1 [Astyanax mexicanus]|uniref:Gametocyte-specific factor 1-like n=2 Tax=Astyanax mexicanus TaxID=7994 RepID=A0A8B9LIF8_ASTMX|nr:gametocyte-specific factor 1 [Astyanax mexicanus]KAG9274355.1 gametocyte-specific factor 1-like [Astyanax mexicanus]